MSAISIGIPTYEAGQSLVKTLTSIYSQSDFNQVKEVLVVIDGKPSIEPQILSQIKHSKLKIIYQKNRQGQSTRINDLLRLSSGEVCILTNDDVIWEKQTLHTLWQTWKKTKADLITTQAQPLPATNLFEQVISIGAVLTNHISHVWSNYDNYLSCNGRLIMLSRSFAKEIKIPRKLWNNDAFIFLQAKVGYFTHVHQPRAVVRYGSPQTLSDHLKQSRKFNFSLVENQQYFKADLQSFYQIPTSALKAGIIKTFTQKPILTLAYLGLTFIMRLRTQNYELPSTGVWATDITTKKI